MQITGLASGLDTNSIISALLAVDQQPITALQKEESGLTAQDTQLSSIQTALQTVALNAQALSDPSLFALTQNVTSSNTTLVSAMPTNSIGVGAVTGGYQVAVSQLASAAQSTFTFASPKTDDTVTIDGSHQYKLSAGASVEDLANAINSDQNGSVWAAVTAKNTVVLSERATGTDTGYVGVSEADDNGNPLTGAGAALSLQTQQQGQNALVTVNNGTPLTEQSNTVTDAIAGVTLNLSGLTTTGTGSPVTIDVSAPAPSTSTIEAAVTTFVNSYNSVLDQMNTQLGQKTSTTDPTQGTLFGDTELEGLMNDMRTSMYSPGAGLPTGMAALSDIGITTGAASGDAAPSADSIEGKLTVDTSTLAQAITDNPNGVEAVLSSWSQSFSQIVNNEAEVGGNLDTRVQGNTSEISDLGNQISSMQANLAVKQQSLEQEYSNMEVLLSQNQTQSSWLSGQTASLSANDISSTSSSG